MNDLLGRQQTRLTPVEKVMIELLPDYDIQSSLTQIT